MSRRWLVPALVLLGTVSALVVQQATAARAAAPLASQQQPCTVPKAFGRYVGGGYLFEDASGTVREFSTDGCKVSVVFTRQ